VPSHGFGEELQRIAALQGTGPCDREQAGGGNLSLRALVSEADLPPDDRVTQRALHAVVGRLYTGVFDKSKQTVAMLK
jgi:hypothetical protein